MEIHRDVITFMGQTSFTFPCFFLRRKMNYTALMDILFIFGTNHGVRHIKSSLL